jgi:hypothetical protein
MKISTVRRKNLGKGPLCSPSEWARGWFATFDTYQPGWRAFFDPTAIEFALIDLMEDDSRRELNPVILDAFSELLAQIRSGNATTIATIQAAAAEICGSPRLPAITERMLSLFRPGLLLQDPSVRAGRKQVFIDFFELIEPVLSKVLNRIEFRQDWEEREQARRYRLMSRPDLVKSAGEVSYGSSDENFSAAAARTVSETKKEISPEALTALREFLWGGGGVTQSEAARAAGVAPSTLTRALEILREKTPSKLAHASKVDQAKFAAALRVATIQEQKGNI